MGGGGGDSNVKPFCTVGVDFRFIASRLLLSYNVVLCVWISIIIANLLGLWVILSYLPREVGVGEGGWVGVAVGGSFQLWTTGC